MKLRTVIFVDAPLSPHPSGPALLLPSSPWLSLEAIELHLQILSWAANDVFPFSCSSDWKNWGGEARGGWEEVQVCSGSVVQVLISVVFPLPGARGTPVFFFSYSKGQLMGPVLFKGILLKPICIHWLQRMCTGLWLIIKKKNRVRSLDGAVGLQLNCFNRASIWR